jgi:hypothetical protein
LLLVADSVEEGVEPEDNDGSMEMVATRRRGDPWLEF